MKVSDVSLLQQSVPRAWKKMCFFPSNTWTLMIFLKLLLLLSPPTSTDVTVTGGPSQSGKNPRKKSRMHKPEERMWQKDGSYFHLICNLYFQNDPSPPLFHPQGRLLLFSWCFFLLPLNIYVPQDVLSLCTSLSPPFFLEGPVFTFTLQSWAGHLSVLCVLKTPQVFISCFPYPSLSIRSRSVFKPPASWTSHWVSLGAFLKTLFLFLSSLLFYS